MSPAARYGDPAATLAVDNDVLRLQLAHRSVRKFGPREVTDGELDALIAAAQSAPTDYLETTLIGFVDTALAAQNAVIAAHSLGLGSVFVGAIRNHPEEVAAELRLPPHSVAAFGLAVGVPDPTERAGVKPRLPREAVLHHELYEVAADEHIGVYDRRLADYNARFGLAGNWSKRVLERLRGPESMSGRHLLREVLQRLGFPSH